MMPGKAYIGTSGWNYKSWRDDFYAETPQSSGSGVCAARFTELRSTARSTGFRRKAHSKMAR
jgi:hypothetical protein